mgnify:FL=1
MKTFSKLSFALLLSALSSVSMVAHAHASVEPSQVVEGSYARLAVKIPHGCDGLPTDTVIVRLSPSFQGAKPMPKAGWDLKTVKTKLANPYDSHGKAITEDVSEIIWSGGSLPSDFYDEFVFQAKVNSAPTTLLIPIEQKCGSKSIVWQGTSHDDAYPAATLKVLPKAPADMAHHH